MNASEFKERFLPMHRKLYKEAYLLLGNEDDAKDMVQDAYMKMWTRRDTLAKVDNPGAYCASLVRNMCLDRHRAASIDIIDKPPEELSVAAPADASLAIERSETRQMLSRCLARLPARQQQVVRLRDVGGCSMQEIEQATGLSAVNIRTLLCRSRKTLRNQLQALLSS